MPAATSRWHLTHFLPEFNEGLALRKASVLELPEEINDPALSRARPAGNLLGRIKVIMYE
jgi:hypothetical protein